MKTEKITIPLTMDAEQTDRTMKDMIGSLTKASNIAKQFKLPARFVSNIDNAVKGIRGISSAFSQGEMSTREAQGQLTKYFAELRKIEQAVRLVKQGESAYYAEASKVAQDAVYREQMRVKALKAYSSLLGQVEKKLRDVQKLRDTAGMVGVSSSSMRQLNKDAEQYAQIQKELLLNQRRLASLGQGDTMQGRTSKEFVELSKSVDYVNLSVKNLNNTYTKHADQLKNVIQQTTGASRSILSYEAAIKRQDKETKATSIALEKYKRNISQLQTTIQKARFAPLSSIQEAQKALSELQARYNTTSARLTKIDETYKKYAARLKEANGNLAEQQRLTAKLNKVQAAKTKAMASLAVQQTKNNTLMAQQRTLLADLSSPKWIANIFQRAVAYAAMYASIHQVIQGLRTMVEYQLEQENAARIFAALTEGADDYSVKLERAHKIEKELVGLTHQWGGSLTEVNQAAMELYRAGIPSNQVVKSTEAVMLLARLTGDTIAQSASAMVTYNMVYGEMAGTADDAGKSVEELADILAYMANASRMSTQDISTFSNYALAMSKAAGISAEATAAMAITLTNVGFNASTAGTQVRKFASMLGDQTPNVQRFFKQIGVSQTSFAALVQDAETSDEAIENFIRRLQSIDSASFTRMVGSLQLLMRNMVTAMRTHGDEMIRQMNRVSEDSAGSLDAAKESTEAWTVTFQRLREQLKSVGDQYTTEFLKSLTEFMKPLLDNPGAIKAYFDGLISGLTDLAKVIGLLGGGAVLFKVASGITSLITAVRGLGAAAVALRFTPIGIALTGLSWAAYEAYDAYSTFSDKLVDSKAEAIKAAQMENLRKETEELNKELRKGESIQYKMDTLVRISGMVEDGTISEDTYNKTVQNLIKSLHKELVAVGSVMSPEELYNMLLGGVGENGLPENVKSKIKDAMQEVSNTIKEVNKSVGYDQAAEFSLTDNMVKQLSSNMGQITKLMRSMKPQDMSQFSSLLEGQQEAVNKYVKGTVATIMDNRQFLKELPDMVTSIDDVLKNLTSPDANFDSVLNAQKQVLLLQNELQKGIEAGDYSEVMGATIQSELDNVSLIIKATLDYYKGMKDAQNIIDTEIESSREDRIKRINEEYTALARKYNQEQKNLESRYKGTQSIVKQYATMLSQEKELADVRAEEGLFEGVESQRMPSVYKDALTATYETLQAQRELNSLQERNKLVYLEKAALQQKINDKVRLEKESVAEYTRLKAQGKGLEESELNLQELQSTLQEDRIKLAEIELSLDRGKTEEARKLLALRRKEFQESEAKFWTEGSFWDGFMRGVEDGADDSFKTIAQQGKALADSLSDSLRSGLTEFYDWNSDKFLDFGNLAVSILQQVLQQMMQMYVVAPMVSVLTSGIGDIFGSLFANANGNVIDQGKIVPYATGGIVTSPTYFPMAGRNIGLMGEAGAEAIMPLTRVNGDLGVKVTGGRTTINIINESGTPVDAKVVEEITKPDGEHIKTVVLTAMERDYSFRQAIRG